MNPKKLSKLILSLLLTLSLIAPVFGFTASFAEDPSTITVVKTEDGVWRTVQGKTPVDYTGIARNQYGWWRTVDGIVDFAANGVYKNEYGWWKVEDGKVNFDYTGIARNEYGWWRIVKGKVDFFASGVYKNEYGWWYVDGGKVQFGFTGLKHNSLGLWYIASGKVDFGFSGTHEYNGNFLTVKGGKAVGADVSSVDYAVKRLNSTGWDTRKAYDWCVNNIKFGNTDYIRDGEIGTSKLAAYGFKNLKGNCYVFAACFCEMGRLLGLTVRQMKGGIPKKDGTLDPHSWTEVVVNGTTYVCDPEFEWQTKRTGYMVTYGQKGTWVYSAYHELAY